MAWLQVAAAQPAPPPSPDAQADYDAGRVLLRDHDDAAALLRFQRSYALRPDPKVLANVALCEKNLNHPSRAATLFAQVLGGDTSAFGPDQRAQLEGLLAASLDGAGRLRVTVAPRPAVVQIDDHAVAPAELASDVLVDAGLHRIRVWKEGYRELVRDVAVSAAGRADVDLELVPLLRPIPPPPRRPPDVDRRPAVWMWVAGGLLLGAFGFVAADSVFR